MSIAGLIVCVVIGVSAQEFHSAPLGDNDLDSIRAAIAKTDLIARYELACRMEPCSLRADFNGDRRPDLAVLIREKVSGKIGIGILHSGSTKAHIVGAGRPCGNGGDNFDWMDVWSVYSKKRVEAGADSGRAPVLRGAAILAERSESASAIIYWTGRRYAWYQQGD